MSEREERRAFYPPPVPGRPDERRWPSPTPLPLFPSEDVGKVLKQILDQLDAIEKRLERIEKLLAEKRSRP